MSLPERTADEETGRRETVAPKGERGGGDRTAGVWSEHAPLSGYRPSMPCRAASAPVSVSEPVPAPSPSVSRSQEVWSDTCVRKQRVCRRWSAICAEGVWVVDVEYKAPSGRKKLRQGSLRVERQPTLVGWAGVGEGR